MARNQSLYYDDLLRAGFLNIAAGLSRDESGEYWGEYISNEIPRLIKEAREFSQTPTRDESFIMGVVSALEARRVLDKLSTTEVEE